MFRVRWQSGYGAFSVSKSVIGRVKNYIAIQEEHHSGRLSRGVPAISAGTRSGIRRALPVGPTAVSPRWGLGSFGSWTQALRAGLLSAAPFGAKTKTEVRPALQVGRAVWWLIAASISARSTDEYARGASVRRCVSNGVAGCLRTPRGGEAEQIVIVVDRGRVKMRWMSPREYARLQVRASSRWSAIASSSCSASAMPFACP